MAGEEAIVVHLMQKKILRKFREQCATDPRQAMTLESLNVKKGAIVSGLIKKKVLVCVSNDRYYLDEDAAEGFFSKKKSTAIIAIIIAAAIGLITLLLRKTI
jgi:hypothetical protein